jgi:predicted ATPase/class 3 adenylate cyclase
MRQPWRDLQRYTSKMGVQQGRARMPDIPSGTVTFLFTDIEGSTRLLGQFPRAYPAALVRHDTLLREAIESHSGWVFETVGDAFYAAFARPSDAVAAAIEAQRALLREQWGEVQAIRARMGLHTGEVEVRGQHYFGTALYRCARLMAIGHGGQTLVSDATTQLVRDSLPSGASLQDEGTHRLKDLASPERVWQLMHPDLPAEFPPLRSLSGVPNNLPAQLTNFVGRERERAEVAQLIRGARLLTLVGAGGAGKTRLALHVAADVLEECTDGVYLVELASLADPGLIPQSVAAALSLREEPGQPLLGTILQYLQPKSLLLVLDNCEHVLAGCAEVADRLLRTCPQLRILATSREPLDVAGETAWRVPSLPVPGPGETPPIEQLTQYDAVRLFIDRARSALGSFSVTNQTAPALAQLCWRLDGIPLAIELAATRVKSLTLEQIAARVDDRFRLLTGGSRTALPRHQTLRAAVDWSYDLLSPVERALFDRLSVFAGGWTLEAAEEVCAGGPIASDDVLDLLTHLVDKSLVLAEARAHGGMRYRMLETLRQYTAEKLQASGDVLSVERRHRDWYLSLAEAAEPELWGPKQVEWFDRLDTELDNLRAALDFSRSTDGAEGLRLATVLWHFWEVRGRLSEGRDWLTTLLSPSDDEKPTGGRALALAAAGYLGLWLGDLEASTAYGEAARRMAHEVGDDFALAFSMTVLGLTSRFRGDSAMALVLLDDAVSRWRRLDEPRGVYNAMVLLGNVMALQGQYDEAATLFERGLAEARQHGDVWSTAGASIAYARLALLQGDLNRARALGRESLALYDQFADMRSVAICLHLLARVDVAAGSSERGARLLGAAEAAAGTIHVDRLFAVVGGSHDDNLAKLEALLGEAVLQAALGAGRAMAEKEAVAYALADPVLVGSPASR